MEITGNDYVIYSTQPTSVFDFKDCFHKHLKARCKHFIVDDEPFYFAENGYQNDECFELFYTKNEEMGDFQEKNGYSLDSNGEGCFMLMGIKLNMIDLNIFVPEQAHDPSRSDILTAEYNSKLLAKNLWEFTLVLPGTVENSLFCKFIMDSFLDSLRKC